VSKIEAYIFRQEPLVDGIFIVSAVYLVTSIVVRLLLVYLGIRSQHVQLALPRTPRKRDYRSCAGCSWDIGFVCEVLAIAKIEK
jgi:hypothetical protein